MNLQGAITGTVISYILPCVFYLKTFKDKLSQKEVYINFCIIGYAVIGGIVATYCSVSIIFDNPDY